MIPILEDVNTPYLLLLDEDIPYLLLLGENIPYLLLLSIYLLPKWEQYVFATNATNSWLRQDTLVEFETTIPEGERNKRKVNGWIMFMKDSMKRAVPKLGESNEMRRQRVWKECQQNWASSGKGSALHRKYQLAAIEENKRVRNEAVVLSEREPKENLHLAISLLPSESEPVVKKESDSAVTPYVNNLQVQPGFGVLGTGDEGFGVSVKSVEAADNEGPGFVTNFASSWRTRTSGQIVSSTQRPQTTQLSCYQDLGFCVRRLSGHQNRFQKVISHLRKFIALHRKNHLSPKGKNQGPDCKIQHPLLFSFRWMLSCSIGFVPRYIIIRIWIEFQV